MKASPLILFIIVASLFFQIRFTNALVPNVVSVASSDIGSTTVLTITVSHSPPPAIGAGHYVSIIQLEINGTSIDLAQSPQSAETFAVQHNLGANTNKYSVRARALCTTHGYSAFSNTAVVPEFPMLNALLLLIFTTTIVVVGRKTRK